MERAYALRDKRESERLAFVQKCYDQQWRDACDDARTLDSKAMDMFLGQDRIATIQEKLRKKQELAGIEMHWLDLYNKHCEELEAAEKAKDDFRIKAAKDLQEGLRRQVSPVLVLEFLIDLLNSCSFSRLLSMTRWSMRRSSAIAVKPTQRYLNARELLRMKKQCRGS